MELKLLQCNDGVYAACTKLCNNSGEIEEVDFHGKKYDVQTIDCISVFFIMYLTT